MFLAISHFIYVGNINDVMVIVVSVDLNNFYYSFHVVEVVEVTHKPVWELR